ncbi:MAG TPA: hypothetical protein DCM59_06715 [Clostridium sp.]|nr:hypothetical protein [Clostridium sp.]
MMSFSFSPSKNFKTKVYKNAVITITNKAISIFSIKNIGKNITPYFAVPKIKGIKLRDKDIPSRYIPI